MGRCIWLLAVFPFLRCPVLPLHLQICIRYFISQRNWKLHYFLMLLENIAPFPFKNAVHMAISSLLFVSSWLFAGNGHCNPCLRSPNRVGFTLWGWKVSTVMRKLPAKLKAEFKHTLIMMPGHAWRTGRYSLLRRFLHTQVKGSTFWLHRKNPEQVALYSLWLSEEGKFLIKFSFLK